MLLPKDVFKLYEKSENKEEFQRTCIELEENNLFFSLDDWEEEINLYGYESLLNLANILIESLTDKNFAENLREKIIWLKRVLQKKYKLTLLKLLYTISEENGFSLFPPLEIIQEKKQMFLNCNYIYDKDDCLIIETDFALHLKKYFQTLPEEELLNLKCSSLFDEMKSIFSHVFCFDETIFANTLSQAIRVYTKFILKELKDSIKALKRKKKEEEEKKFLLKKYYPEFIEGQETLSFCKPISERISEIMEIEKTKKNNSKRTRKLTKKESVDINQYSLFPTIK